MKIKVKTYEYQGCVATGEIDNNNKFQGEVEGIVFECEIEEIERNLKRIVDDLKRSKR